jgi:hypothetical protein
MRRAALIVAALIPMVDAASTPSAAETMTVVLDQARIARLPDKTSTVVVGNPLIADVSIQSGGAMVVTGKGYGITNVILLDRNGKVLADHQVRVRTPSESVVVYRGMARESYNCSPYCEPRITLGDTSDFFDPTINQTTGRNLRAQQGQAAAGQR